MGWDDVNKCSKQGGAIKNYKVLASLQNNTRFYKVVMVKATKIISSSTTIKIEY